MTARPPITSVTGGAAGITATYAAVRALAAHLDATGDRLRACADADARVLADPDLLESAPLSPISFAEAEAHILDATSGVHGVLESALACEVDAVVVRGVVAAYQECDRLVATTLHTLDYAVGRAVGSAAPGLLALGLLAAPAWRRLPQRTRRRLEADVEQWADRHPEAVQHAVDGSGGFLDGLMSDAAAAGLVTALAPFHPSAGDAAGDLALLYPPEGPPRVRRRRDLEGAATRPPRSLTGLMRRLQRVDDLSLPGCQEGRGTMEIQTFRAPDGTARHVVYLPGTDDMTTMPWSHDSDARDLPADLHVISGDRSTYAAGIERAMAEAGIGPRDPVLLVGHSLGGMEAAGLLAHGSPFRVTHVVTAGSPVGGVHPYPAGSHVLSLENRADVVPLLDGRDNTDTAQQVTVQFDEPGTSVVDSHDLRHYVHGAEAADASGDPSVRAALSSLRHGGFLGSPGEATSQVFQITR